MQHPAALAAMGARPPLPPGMALPSMMPQVSAAQASAAAQLRLQQQLAAKHQFQPILKCALCCAVHAGHAAHDACCGVHHADCIELIFAQNGCVASSHLLICPVQASVIVFEDVLFLKQFLVPCLSFCRPQSEDDRQFVPQARLQVGCS